MERVASTRRRADLMVVHGSHVLGRGTQVRDTLIDAMLVRCLGPDRAGRTVGVRYTARHGK